MVFTEVEGLEGSLVGSLCSPTAHTKWVLSRRQEPLKGSGSNEFCLAVLARCAQWGTNQATLSRVTQEEKALVERAQ